jgi:hypothetical protein
VKLHTIIEGLRQVALKEGFVDRGFYRRFEEASRGIYRRFVKEVSRLFGF